MKIEKILLDIAKDDLKASLLLYKSKLYAQSLFYYQQSVEKAIKAYAISSDMIKPEDLRKKVSHDTTEIYKIFWSGKKQKIEELIEFTKEKPDLLKIRSFAQIVLPETLQDVDKKIEFFKQFDTKKKKIAHLSGKNILEIIDILSAFKFTRLRLTKKSVLTIVNEYEVYIKDLIEIYAVLKTKNSEETIKELKFLSFNNILNKKNGINKLIRIFNKLLYLTQKMIYASYTLFWCSVIALPHSVDARYPNIKEKSNPYKRYNKNNPLIKYLPVFIQFQQKTLRILPNLLG